MNSAPTIYYDNNFLNKKEINYIKDNIFSGSLPLLYFESSTTNDFVPFFGHILIDRNTNKSKSKHTNFFKKLAKKITKQYDIKINKFLRANINFTFPFKQESIFHKDHIFDHYNLIIYLNNSDGYTEIKHKDQLIQVEPKLGKYVLFKTLSHRALAPSNGVRVICVMTFN